MADMQLGNGDYFIDIVMCIDGTASMSPIIDNVKANALSFYEQFLEAMEANSKSASQVRVKVIVFRDYGCDANPMEESKFFLLPDEKEDLHNFVNGIEAIGGGDIPENGLEALALAMKSDWTTGGSNRRHAILMFSDAPALELGARKDVPGYPEGMPESLGQLGEWWTGESQEMGGTFQANKGRLVLFVPNASPWSEIQTWGRIWPAFSKAGEGLKEASLQNALDILVGSF